jgi:hypothetical protein
VFTKAMSDTWGTFVKSASLQRLPARQESPVAEAETAFDGCPRMPEDKREWKTTIDLTSGTSRRVGVPAHRDQTKWARTPKLLVFCHTALEFFSKFGPVSAFRSSSIRGLLSAIRDPPSGFFPSVSPCRRESPPSAR